MENHLEPGREKRFINSLMLLSLLIAFLTVGLALFWIIYPYNPLVVKSAVVDPNKVETGDAIFLTIDYCKRAGVGERVNRYLQGNNKVIQLPPVDLEANTSRGCNKVEIPIRLPDDIIPDLYKLHYVVDYKVNPIRTETIEFYSEEFEVVK